MKIIGDAIEVEPISNHRILSVIYAMGRPETSYPTYTTGNGYAYATIVTRDSGILTFQQDVSCRIRLTAKAGYSSGSLYTCINRVRKTDLTGTTSTILSATTTTNGAVNVADNFIFKKGEQIWGEYHASKADVYCLVLMVVAQQ